MSENNHQSRGSSSFFFQGLVNTFVEENIPVVVVVSDASVGNARDNIWTVSSDNHSIDSLNPDTVRRDISHSEQEKGWLFKQLRIFFFYPGDVSSDTAYFYYVIIGRVLFSILLLIWGGYGFKIVRDTKNLFFEAKCENDAQKEYLTPYPYIQGLFIAFSALFMVVTAFSRREGKIYETIIFLVSDIGFGILFLKSWLLIINIVKEDEIVICSNENAAIEIQEAFDYLYIIEIPNFLFVGVCCSFLIFLFCESDTCQRCSVRE